MTGLLARAVTRDLDLWLDVAPVDWRVAHCEALSAGYDRCEWVTAADRNGMRLVSQVSGPAGWLVIATTLAGEQAESIADLFTSASFHEREIAQMFGIAFEGSADTRPAFAVDFGGHPLRRAFALGPRVQTPWPGAHDPDGQIRRRPAPSPGVNSEWIA